MSNYLVTDTELTGVANKIRTKGGTNSLFSWPTGYESAIEAISTGTDVSDTTAAAGDVLSGKYFYTAAGIKTQGTITEQSAQTIVPTTSDQTIASGKYLSGAQTIKGDANLIAANIKKDVIIFGVTGTHEGGNGYVWQDENGYVHLDPSSGGGNSARKDVNFYDYDGCLVAAYTTAEFANITELPANPIHTGLTAQGWNWSLADAKTYVASYGRLNIGQMYITTDGKTHVHIHLEQGRTSPMLGVCPNGTVDVDWGDNTAHDTLTGTSTSTVQWTPTHNYAALGDYVIKLTVSEGGSMGFYGVASSNQYSGLLRYSSSADGRNSVYRNAIQSLFIGSGVTSIEYSAFNNCSSLSSITLPSGVTSIVGGAFSNCYSLSSITIPSGVTSIVDGAFNNCYSLSSITIPIGVTSIASGVFSNCSSLSSITLPSGVTSIGSGAFSSCYSLSSITLPSGLTSIDGGAFGSCYSLSNITIPIGVTSINGGAFSNCNGFSELHFNPSNPPTAGGGAFAGIPTDCKIYVPAGRRSAYTSASNYPSSSTYTYVEE